MGGISWVCTAVAEIGLLHWGGRVRQGRNERPPERNMVAMFGWIDVNDGKTVLYHSFS